MDLNFGGWISKGGIVMWPLLILSVVSWAVILERSYVYLTIRVQILDLARALLASLRSGDLASAKTLCHGRKPLIGEIFLPTLDSNRTRTSVERINSRRKVEFAQYMRKNLWILGTIGSASPFIGLLGTVVGIIKVFHEMESKGTGGFSTVSAGISEALIATGAGLVVAIVALFCYNAFVALSNQTSSQLKLCLDEMTDSVFDAAGQTT